MKKILTIFAVLAIILSATASFAQDGELQPVDGALSRGESFTSRAEKDTTLAKIKDGATDDLEAVGIIVVLEEGAQESALEAVSGGTIIHRYSVIFNGVSMIVAPDKVEEIAAADGVKKIYLDELLQPDTEVSPAWIGAPTAWGMLGGQDYAGEGVVVGVLDTGVWPEHPSFADPGPSGRPYPAPPGGPYDCDFGNTTWNPNDLPWTCNNKLIGAYEFLNTYKAVIGLLSAEFDSARDADGHGTHTSSTAAGNGGVASSIFGVPRGVVSGVAPRAHVIMYKVCGDLGCFTSDSAAAVEQAILDGADALNFSISGGGDPYNDVVSLAFLAAYDNGVFVAASAGNSGPSPDSVAHREPWTTTVAASTSDRHFLSTVTVVADNSDTLTFQGATVTAGISVATPIIFPPAGKELCLDPFAPGTFSGEIVICERGQIARVEKSYNVSEGGAGGMILYNPTLQGLATDNHFIPSVHIENDTGADLLAFMAAHTGETATFTQGVATTVQGDKMAAFSSRGGPAQQLGISKPDVTAPGVQILAGHTPLPATVVGGLPGEYFQSIQGTSMSSPHVAGAGALIKDIHPDWGPGKIKSALMTAATKFVVKEDGTTDADAFDMGSGRINLNRAGDPGLTISETADGFVALEDELWNANLPSVYIPVMPGQITVQRTVQSELPKGSHWYTSVDSPHDLDIMVPWRLRMLPGAEKTFDITIDAREVPMGEVRFATLYLTSYSRTVRIPITIVRRQPVVSMEKECTPPVLGYQETTDCTITIQNNSFEEAYFSMHDRVPRHMPIVPGSVVGAEPYFMCCLHTDGTLYGAEPPLVDVEVNPEATEGYVPLSGFSPYIVGPLGDEEIENWYIPPFEYAGETYDEIGIVSNGYIVVGGGDGADVEYINSALPDASLPNNTLAPFWTDLNPSYGGNIYLQVLTDGFNTWTIVEFEDIGNWSTNAPNTFQVWIGTNSDSDPSQDITFTYGPSITGGDGGWLTVGAENEYGNSGGMTYFDGAGDPPQPGDPFIWPPPYGVKVLSIPGAPGETHTITFTMKAKRLGAWTNCAEMSSDLFQGVNTACFSGFVNP